MIPTAEGNTSVGTATVKRLRTALAGVPGHTEVGGNTAQNVDFNSAVYGNFPLMLAAIALVTFLLLARSLRSVVLAIKAVVVNIISLGATFGFLVLFWQNGHGSDLVYGVPATGSIRNWIPIITFAFLFGISMDYEVFILSRIREEHDRSPRPTTPSSTALARTGRLVSCAALILAISFASLSADPDIVVEMIATGLAVGVVLDAVIVRTLLVPAFVAIMGRWNWWMPDSDSRGSFGSSRQPPRQTPPGHERALGVHQPTVAQRRQPDPSPRETVSAQTPRPSLHRPAVRLKPPSRAEANARLTGTAGIVVLILLIAELVTVVLGAASVLSLHVAIGLILVPPVLVKLASTTWRMVNYYIGAATYTHRGPPPTLARILGPILSLAIVLVLISGIALILGPSSIHHSALQVHKVTFYLALLLIVVHLAMHLTKAVRLLARDWVNRRGPALFDSGEMDRHRREHCSRCPARPGPRRTRRALPAPLLRPVAQTKPARHGRRSGHLPGRWLARRLRQRHNAAKESNLPSQGLPGPASFEDLQPRPQTPVPTGASRSRE